MSAPLFLHIMVNGDIWASNNISDTPSGTVAAIFRVNSDTSFKKLGTVTGTTGTMATSGSTGKYGTEVK